MAKRNDISNDGKPNFSRRRSNATQQETTRRGDCWKKENSPWLTHSGPRSGASHRKGTWPGPEPLPCTPSCRHGRRHAGRKKPLDPPNGHGTLHRCLATGPLPLPPAASSELLLPRGLRPSGRPGKGGPQPASHMRRVRHAHTFTQSNTGCRVCGPQPASHTSTVRRLRSVYLLPASVTLSE